MDQERLLRIIDRFLLFCLCVLGIVLPMAHTETIRAFALGIPGVLWGLKAILTRRLIFRRTPVDLPIVLFTLVAGLSILTAVDPRYSLEQFVGEWLLGVYLYYLAVNNVRLEQMKYLLGAFLVGNLIMISYGIYDFSVTGGSFVDYKIRANSLHSGFYEFSVYLVMSIPYLLMGIIQSKRTGSRFPLIILLFVNLLALFFTHTRGAWLAVIILFLVVMWKYMDRRVFFPLFAMAIVAILLFAPQKILIHHTNFVTPKNESFSIETFQARWQLTKFVLQKISENPFQMAGYGQRSFVKKYPEFDERYKGAQLWHPHNTFLAIALGTGVQGLAIFLFFQYRLLRYLHSRSEIERIPLRKFYFLGTFMMVICYFVVNSAADFFVDDSALLFWLLSGIAFPVDGKSERSAI